MKKQLRQFFINRLLKKHRATTEYNGWDSVTSILLLWDFSSDKQRQKVNELISNLEKEGKRVEQVQYIPQKRPKEGAQEKAYYSTETGFFMQPKRTFINHLTKSTDVLIDWSTLPNTPNDFLALQTAAQLKIGVDRTLPIYDIQVSDDGLDAKKTSNEILKYLKLINK